VCVPWWKPHTWDVWKVWGYDIYKSLYSDRVVRKDMILQRTCTKCGDLQIKKVIND
jgi:hypothetical protein